MDIAVDCPPFGHGGIDGVAEALHDPLGDLVLAAVDARGRCRRDGVGGATQLGPPLIGQVDLRAHCIGR